MDYDFILNIEISQVNIIWRYYIIISDIVGYGIKSKYPIIISDILWIMNSFWISKYCKLISFDDIIS